MTPLQLLDALEAFVEQETKDILLPVRVDRKSGENKERAAEVYKMRLPNKTAQTERVPYLLLQYIKSTDTQEQGAGKRMHRAYRRRHLFGGRKRGRNVRLEPADANSCRPAERWRCRRAVRLEIST